MSNIQRPLMPQGLPADLQGIYRLLGYEDKNNYDDERYAEQYAVALNVLKAIVGGGVLPVTSDLNDGTYYFKLTKTADSETFSWELQGSTPTPSTSAVVGTAIVGTAIVG